MSKRAQGLRIRVDAHFRWRLRPPGWAVWLLLIVIVFLVKVIDPAMLIKLIS